MGFPPLPDCSPKFLDPREDPQDVVDADVIADVHPQDVIAKADDATNSDQQDLDVSLKEILRLNF